MPVLHWSGTCRTWDVSDDEEVHRRSDGLPSTASPQPVRRGAARRVVPASGLAGWPEPLKYGGGGSLPAGRPETLLIRAAALRELSGPRPSRTRGSTDS